MFLEGLEAGSSIEREGADELIFEQAEVLSWIKPGG
jgi:hypothetical protein